MLLDPFGREVRLPGDFSRQGRVALLGEAADALMRGELPRDEARIFLAAGVMAWLQRGGDLLKDYWRVRGRQGSNNTPAVIWSSLTSASRSATSGEETATIDPSDSPDSERSSA